MMEILLLGLPLLLLLVAVVLNVYLRSTAFKTVIACADEQSARVLPEPPVEGGVVGMSTAPVDPEVSIVVPVQNEADALSRHLPLFLSQRFAHYEVVVANAAAEDALTADVVKNFQDHHAHLRYTFVPESRRRNVDAHKVAVALGIRAARAPWLVVVEPDCAPSSNEWLQHLSTHCTDENDVVMGYANYEEAEGGAVSEPVRERALHWARCVRSVLSGHAAAADSCHVAFRREWFLQSGGFAGSLDLPFGACALMASRADAQRVAVEMHPNSVVRQQVPDSETLYLRRLESSPQWSMPLRAPCPSCLRSTNCGPLPVWEVWRRHLCTLPPCPSMVPNSCCLMYRRPCCSFGCCGNPTAGSADYCAPCTKFESQRGRSFARKVFRKSLHS